MDSESTHGIIATIGNWNFYVLGIFFWRYSEGSQGKGKFFYGTAKAHKENPFVGFYGPHKEMICSVLLAVAGG